MDIKFHFLIIGFHFCRRKNKKRDWTKWCWSSCLLFLSSRGWMCRISLRKSGNAKNHTCTTSEGYSATIVRQQFPLSWIHRHDWVLNICWIIADLTWLWNGCNTYIWQKSYGCYYKAVVLDIPKWCKTSKRNSTVNVDFWGIVSDDQWFLQMICYTSWPLRNV